MRVLVAGFEPFGGDKVNSSWEAVKLLPGSTSGAEVVKEQLPVSFRRVRELIPVLLEKYRPSLLLLTGQATGISSLHVERVAINVMDARIEDNDGYKPEDEPVFPGAPAAYFATIPLKRAVEAIRSASVPASVSNSAGTFVCNAAMYTALHYVAVNGLDVMVGFVHVPSLPVQALSGNTPSMPSELAARGLEACIAVCLGELERRKAQASASR
ncbi:pyroglutamyl-peptidase I [Infirmifilum lucidum]|uniref:Pyroglutamyl-peptidase I n=1 Tax=Infirmifilum lucidum TaxID=2776706 RepID=A0A7L9FJ39_9CREN|nr:pyroglutamyl-peptidase I [Infirmifilum lucidum]QOJ78934.1 pyroglutamyl-peptidase I [Infirmifilum lucidum]